MGNRGCLHDEAKRLTSRRWARLAWVTCTLSRKSIRRELMAPGRYTELFFLDEPTALAAGHRPCAECRREDYQRFLFAFTAALGVNKLSATDMDRRLHQDRTQEGDQKTFFCATEALPTGAMIQVEGDCFLWWAGRGHRWQPTGYSSAVAIGPGQVRVLTPLATFKALQYGYRPTPHASLRHG